MPFRSFAVIPAAGHSRRMGRPKLLLPWRDSVLIEHVLTQWKAGGVDHITVVCRREDRELIACCSQANATVVAPSEPLPEMKHSVAAGLAEIETKFQPVSGDVWLLAPGDLPGLSAAVIRRLRSAHRPDSPSILAPTWRGQRGHPVLFPWSTAVEVAALGENQGVNVLLQRHPVRAVAFGREGVPADVDTPEDYRRLRAQSDECE